MLMVLLPLLLKKSRGLSSDGQEVRQNLDGMWRVAVHRCVADEVKPGKLTSFPQSVKLKADEMVVFSWIVYTSRQHRDSVNAKVMAGPRITSINPKSMPFDGKRMFWGGFKNLVEL